MAALMIKNLCEKMKSYAPTTIQDLFRTGPAVLRLVTFPADRATEVGAGSWSSHGLCGAARGRAQCRALHAYYNYAREREREMYRSFN